jgi:hypothetical protein
LGFVALNPTYILPVLLRNAKPNNGRFRNRAPKVSISIKLAAFQARGGARMKLRLPGTVKRLNAQHRTSNIDNATLYLFKNKRTAEY